MKSNTHPENYRLVAFKDMSNNDVFITKSTVETKETTKIDGVEYPLFKLEISRTSHPYYTGKSKLVDTAGRVDKFRSKYANFNQAPAAEDLLLKRHLLHLLLKRHLLLRKRLLLKRHLLLRKCTCC